MCVLWALHETIKRWHGVGQNIDSIGHASARCLEGLVRQNLDPPEPTGPKIFKLGILSHATIFEATLGKGIAAAPIFCIVSLENILLTGCAAFSARHRRHGLLRHRRTAYSTPRQRRPV